MLGDGNATVAAAGTRQKLSAASVAFRSVTITAREGNAGVVVVGGKTVVAAAEGRSGTPLSPGDSISLSGATDAAGDLSGIWLDAVSDGDGVTYSYTFR